MGGQANVGRGWVQSWIANDKAPSGLSVPTTSTTATVADTEISSELSTPTHPTDTTVGV